MEQEEVMPGKCGNCDHAVAVGDAPWGESRVRCIERDEVMAADAEGCEQFARIGLLDRARRVFDSPGAKVSGLTWREAFDAMAVGETVRRAAWKDCVVGLRIPEAGEFANPFLCLIAQFKRKDGSVETSRKAWTPYIDDFQTKDWSIE
jgi:hypothetical protein